MSKKYTDYEIQTVWNKGASTLLFEDDLWRQDAEENLIKRDEYGNRDSDYGWEIDHIIPNGNDDMSNLQPLQWEANVRKSDNIY